MLEAALRIFSDQSDALEIFIYPSDAILEWLTRDLPAKLVCSRNLEPPNTSIANRRSMLEAKQRPKMVGASVIEIRQRLNPAPPFTRERQIEGLAAKEFGLLQIPTQQLAGPTISLPDADQGNMAPTRK